jgi:hypothetical protein
MRQYLREEPKPTVAPRHLRRAIADFEAQLDTMSAALRHLSPHAGAIEDYVALADAPRIESAALGALHWRSAR